MDKKFGFIGANTFLVLFRTRNKELRTKNNLQNKELRTKNNLQNKEQLFVIFISYKPLQQTTMKKTILKLSALLIITLVLPLNALCQEDLIISRKSKSAFMKQTRQEDGNPGKNYWQNSADYTIKATVDVDKKMLSGTEKIIYYNNSPDTLKSLVIRLYQDLFKKGANRLSLVDINPLDVNDGVAIHSVTIAGRKYADEDLKRQGTIMIIPLKDRLAPAKNIELNIDWDFKIPEHTLVRMGTIDSTSLFIAQWYPQMAVYDDVAGWDRLSYNGMAEFYNDFCNFDVEIKVPQGFIVWATGEPANLNEVLQPAIYQKYRKATAGDEIIKVVSADDLRKHAVTTSTNTWKYKAASVSDFAFGLSDHYEWDVTSVLTDKTLQRRTIVSAAYNPTAVHFNKVALIARETVKYLSEEMPGIPYPFPYITAFHGDFGMEYPMITNVGPDEDYGTTVYAHSHEIAHAYFPFLVGTNETRNGWIDEGLVVFMPEKVQLQLEPTYDVARNNTAAFSVWAGVEDEVSLITPTYYLNPGIYFYLNYAKTEQALRMLEMELGPDVFKKCLQAFVERWQYKHPTPVDFFNTFSNVAQQDLNWYWQAWYYQNGGFPDMAVTVDENGSQTEGKLMITVVNKGDIPLPVVLTFYNDDKLLQTITQPAKKWTETNSITVEFTHQEAVTMVKLGNDVIPDVNREDNTVTLPAR